MVHKNFHSAFRALDRRMMQAKTKLPTEIANTGTRHFVGHFTNERSDEGAWKLPQRKIPGTNAFKYPKGKDLGRRTRKILVKSGKLKREVNNSVKLKTYRRIEWRVSGLPYAKVHNDGLNGMPKREFIGGSRTLYALFKRKIINGYRIALK